MATINEFINEAGVCFLGTTDGDQPKIRPIGAHMTIEGKERFAIGTFKDVYKQIVANPKVEIVAIQGSDWLRFTGTAVIDDDPKYAETFLDANPYLRNIYNEETGNVMGTFYLTDYTAVVIHMMGEGDPISE